MLKMPDKLIIALVPQRVNANLGARCRIAGLGRGGPGKFGLVSHHHRLADYLSSNARVWYNTPMEVKSVSQVTQYIKTLFDGDQDLGDLWVEGEVSSFSRASSGHCYFTLKDIGSELRCVMWRNQAQRLLSLPGQGDWVTAHGYVSVYERGGVYQFYVDALHRRGVGALWRAFQELRDRLQAEGLFDEARKRPLPEWPRRIGVVTSPTGAAFRDILNVLRTRYAVAHVVLSPSPVQGVLAPLGLVRAIQRLDELGDVDVVIVARGGGSPEDLAAFNDERVARAVAGCRAPVASGVGHETDFTITDFVADLRAPTPSAAAAAVVPDARQLLVQISQMARRLTLLMNERIAGWRELLAREERLLHLYDPRRALAERRQRVDDLVRRATSAVGHHLSLTRMRLDGSQARLEALNPRLVLGRGYAVVQDRASGVVIKSASQAWPGQALRIDVHDGHLGAKVTEVDPGP